MEFVSRVLRERLGGVKSLKTATECLASIKMLLASLLLLAKM